MYSRELDLMEGDRNRPLLATRGEESVVCMQMSARCAPPPWRSPLGVAQHCKFWCLLHVMRMLCMGCLLRVTGMLCMECRLRVMEMLCMVCSLRVMGMLCMVCLRV